MSTTQDAPVLDRVRELFITGLKNAHGLEKQALSIMEPQVARIEHYPEVAEKLRSHIDETHGQIRRLDEIMSDLDESGSTFKDMTMSMGGSMAAIAHSFAGDEIIKNSIANFAFENYEIASYTALIALAEEGFSSAVSLLEQTLDEERRMAEWIEQSLPKVTRRYAGLSAEQGSFTAKS
ncbi:MAG TPA: ferritin-like domain-containing protein [Sphingomonas sp.]|nr:ferritin-like domain-containing protein [Sphingomonas sp.]